MSFSEILNILLGGGLLALVVGVITLRATVRKANAEAEKARAEAERAKAEAESVRITNTENATRILMENIVKPLKEELYATREDLQATKKQMASTQREMARLRKAVEAVTDCPHSDDCPVRRKLRDNRKDADGGDPVPADRRTPRHGNCRETSDPDADDTGKPCGDDDSGGQPP